MTQRFCFTIKLKPPLPVVIYFSFICINGIVLHLFTFYRCSLKLSKSCECSTHRLKNWINDQIFRIFYRFVQKILSHFEVNLQRTVKTDHIYRYLFTYFDEKNGLLKTCPVYKIRKNYLIAIDVLRKRDRQMRKFLDMKARGVE